MILIVGLSLYVVGTAGAEYFTARFSLVVVILGVSLYLGGPKIARQIWFPIAFLVFMIPIPYVIYYALTFPLQLFSTKTTVFLLHLIGLNVIRQGNVIILPSNYSLDVEEACSGLRSLISLSALGAAFAYLTQRTFWKRVVLFISSIPIAIGANIFRVFITAMCAYLISPKLAEGFLHKFSGVMVFIIALLFLFVLGGILRWSGRKRSIGSLSV